MTFADITSSLAPELERLNTIIAEALDTPTPLMNEIVTRYLLTKGKQIRPVMVLLSARLLGEISDRVLHAAAAMEMLHNASLIHDDVVDDHSHTPGTPDYKCHMGQPYSRACGRLFHVRGT